MSKTALKHFSEETVLSSSAPLRYGAQRLHEKYLDERHTPAQLTSMNTKIVERLLTTRKMESLEVIPVAIQFFSFGLTHQKKTAPCSSYCHRGVKKYSSNMRQSKSENQARAAKCKLGKRKKNLKCLY